MSTLDHQHEFHVKSQVNLLKVLEATTGVPSDAAPARFEPRVQSATQKNRCREMSSALGSAFVRSMPSCTAAVLSVSKSAFYYLFLV